MIEHVFSLVYAEHTCVYTCRKGHTCSRTQGHAWSCTKAMCDNVRGVIYDNVHKAMYDTVHEVIYDHVCEVMCDYMQESCVIMYRAGIIHGSLKLETALIFIMNK